MKGLLKKILLFIVPFLIYGITCYTLDPYCYFSEYKGDKLKKQVAIKMNGPLWRILRMKDNLKNKIFLGNSKMALFDPESIEEMTGEQFSDMTFGGCTIEEQFQLYWLYNEDYNFEHIIFEVDVLSYNLNNSRDRVSGVVSILDNPFLYIFNFNALEAMINIHSAKLKAENPSTRNKEKFWQAQLSTASKRYLSTFKYPEDYKNRFAEIKKDMDEHGGKMSFFFCPIHTDLQKLYYKSDFNMSEAKQRIINELSPLGTVYDADFENALTSNDSLFKDPFHIKGNVLNDKYYKLFEDNKDQFLDSLIIKH